MVAWGLAASATIAAAAACFYIAVGLHILRRPVEPGFSWANSAFGSGWVALGVMVGTDGARIATGIGTPDPALYLTLVELKIVATAFAITAFLTYVLFLYTGRPALALAVPITTGLAYILFFLTLTLQRLPMEIHVGTWATRMELLTPGTMPFSQPVGIALYFLPLLATTLMYLLLWRRVPSRAQHWRILAVGLSLVVFQVAASVQANPDVSPDSPMLPAALVVMMLAGVFSYAAFCPPQWVRARLGVDRLGKATVSRPMA